MVMPGANVFFSVIADGEELMYQWQKDGDNIDDMAGVYSGTDTANLTVLSAREPDDEGVYTVAVFNSAGLQISDPATLEIGECLLHAFILSVYMNSKLRFLESITIPACKLVPHSCACSLVNALSEHLHTTMTYEQEQYCRYVFFIQRILMHHGVTKNLLHNTMDA